MICTNSFVYCQAERIKKKKCFPIYLARTHGIYIFKVEQIYSNTCIGDSYIVFILYVRIGIPAYPLSDECIQYTCTIYMVEDLRISYCSQLVFFII